MEYDIVKHHLHRECWAFQPMLDRSSDMMNTTRKKMYPYELVDGRRHDSHAPPRPMLMAVLTIDRRCTWEKGTTLQKPSDV
jgi:hypothetical protein